MANLLNHNCYQVSESVVFRKVGSEVVIIHLEDGQFFHFSESAEAFLSYFRQSRHLEDYLRTTALDFENSEEALYIQQLCTFLVDNAILVKTDKPSPSPSTPLPNYERPSFLRRGKQTLDEITFLCP